VLVSYFVQTRLSARLKYHSLYEAQVQGRAQSPARYVENVELALRLLGTRKLPKAAKVGHLDLVALLDSGVPVQLPGRKELHLGVLLPESALVGKTIQTCYDMARGGALEIIGIVRGGEIILPTRDTVLQEHDRLIIIGSGQARASISEHVAPIEPPKAQEGIKSAG
jgi:chloride channel protein, CIC family